MYMHTRRSPTSRRRLFLFRPLLCVLLALCKYVILVTHQYRRSRHTTAWRNIYVYVYTIWEEFSKKKKKYHYSERRKFIFYYTSRTLCCYFLVRIFYVDIFVGIVTHTHTHRSVCRVSFGWRPVRPGVTTILFGCFQINSVNQSRNYSIFSGPYLQTNDTLLSLYFFLLDVFSHGYVYTITFWKQ